MLSVRRDFRLESEWLLPYPPFAAGHGILFEAACRQRRVLSAGSRVHVFVAEVRETVAPPHPRSRTDAPSSGRPCRCAPSAASGMYRRITSLRSTSRRNGRHSWSDRCVRHKAGRVVRAWTPASPILRRSSNERYESVGPDRFISVIHSVREPWISAPSRRPHPAKSHRGALWQPHSYYIAQEMLAIR